RCHSRPQLSITGSQPVISHRHPGITEFLRRGRDLCIDNTDLFPVRSCIAEPYKACAYSEAHTQPSM
ncbi:unnamed protein product, partial [Staurois parvus]